MFDALVPLRNHDESSSRLRYHNVDSGVIGSNKKGSATDLITFY